LQRRLFHLFLVLALHRLMRLPPHRLQEQPDNNHLNRSSNYTNRR
jgi:hypothetical protein